ncbi:MAG TPA: response regulator [Candidatus Acidoferrales bacterium]|jgi:CheY-like chemotaxis protein
MKTLTEIEPRKQSHALPVTTTAKSTRALVVEDEESMCALIREALGAASIEDVTSKGSAEAAAQFQGEKFDVILVDKCAPPMDPTHVVREIRLSNINRKTPIILISGDQRPAALVEGFKAGASFFAYKPIDRAHLMSLIRVTQGTIEYEKRRFRRVAVRTKVRIKCGDKSMEGETIDLSMNGALVRASDTFSIGSHVEVSLFLLDGQPPIASLGSVVRLLKDNQMGILIDRMRGAESGRLQEYLLPFTS